MIVGLCVVLFYKESRNRERERRVKQVSVFELYLAGTMDSSMK